MGSSPSKNTTCIYSEWSNWGPCVNGESKRTRNSGDPTNCFDVTQTQPCKEDKQTACCNVCNNSSSLLSYNEKQSDSNNKLSYNYGKTILLTNILIIILVVIILVRKR